MFPTLLSPTSPTPTPIRTVNPHPAVHVLLGYPEQYSNCVDSTLDELGCGGRLTLWPPLRTCGSIVSPYNIII